MWKLKRLAQLVPAEVKLSDDACFRPGVINHVEIRTSHLCQLKALSDGAAFAAPPRNDAMGPACVERGLYGAIASATPVSRSWSTDLNRTGSLTAADAPYGVYWH